MKFSTDCGYTNTPSLYKITNTATGQPITSNPTCANINNYNITVEYLGFTCNISAAVQSHLGVYGIFNVPYNIWPDYWDLYEAGCNFPSSSCIIDPLYYSPLVYLYSGCYTRNDIVFKSQFLEGYNNIAPGSLNYYSVKASDPSGTNFEIVLEAASFGIVVTSVLYNGGVPNFGTEDGFEYYLLDPQLPYEVEGTATFSNLLSDLYVYLVDPTVPRLYDFPDINNYYANDIFSIGSLSCSGNKCGIAETFTLSSLFTNYDHIVNRLWKIMLFACDTPQSYPTPTNPNGTFDSVVGYVNGSSTSRLFHLPEEHLNTLIPDHLTTIISISILIKLEIIIVKDSLLLPFVIL
jgi:hypothetical protein